MIFVIKRYLPAILWAGIIAFLSLTAATNLPKLDWTLFTPDKVGHFTVYAILSMTFIWAFLWQQKEKTARYYGYATLLASAYGVLMEYLQFQLTPDRQFEYPDILANIIGAIVGVLFSILLKL
jgi:VanZ family protein